MRIGKVSQKIYPEYSSCNKCRTTWNLVNPHFTNYTERKGCFPLCEECWSELTIEQRLPFYEMMWEDWKHMGYLLDKSEWIKIKEAVLVGK